MAEKLRGEGALRVLLRDAGSFVGLTNDPADSVVIMPDVSERKRQMIRETYPTAFQNALPSTNAEAATVRRRGRPRKVA
jgi:hypothetical protein